MGGYHIGVPKDEQESMRLIRSAIDRGITFMDNCWDYMDGKCEVWMGKALRDGYRQKVFLMTKFDGRTKAATAKQIDESLQRLQTDRVDLMQYHENIRMEDPDRFFNEGVVDALLDAKKAGKIRYIGFTGHKDPVVHLRMLEVAKAHNFHFDSAQMPLNILDAQFRSFAHDVVPKLVEQRDRGARNEADVRRRAAAERARHRRGMPALCAHAADFRSDHGDHRPEDSRPGIRGCAYVQAVDRGRSFRRCWPRRARRRFPANWRHSKRRRGRTGRPAIRSGWGSCSTLVAAWDRASPICRPRPSSSRSTFPPLRDSWR